MDLQAKKHHLTPKVNPCCQYLRYSTTRCLRQRVCLLKKVNTYRRTDLQLQFRANVVADNVASSDVLRFQRRFPFHLKKCMPSTLDVFITASQATCVQKSENAHIHLFVRITSSPLPFLLHPSPLYMGLVLVKVPPCYEKSFLASLVGKSGLKVGNLFLCVGALISSCQQQGSTLKSYLKRMQR